MAIAPQRSTCRRNPSRTASIPYPKAVNRFTENLDGNFAKFLELSQQPATIVFDDIRDILERQFNRLTDIEKSVMYWLATKRESVLFEELQADFATQKWGSELLEALGSLQRRSLIDKISTGFTLQPVVMEYLTERFIKLCSEKITLEEISFSISYEQMKPTAKNYLGESNILPILEPILDKLNTTF